MVRDVSIETGIELRTMIVAAIGGAVTVWDIAFWLGVHGTIFYGKIFTLWASATAVLLVALLAPKEDRFLNSWGIIALLSPTIWFVVNALTPLVDPTWFDTLVWLFSLANFIFTIPYILYILAQLVESDAIELSPAYRNRLIGIMFIIASIGFLVGSNHQSFVSCEQFAIAGDTAPADCENWQLTD